MQATIKPPKVAYMHRTRAEALRLGISEEKLIHLAKTGVIPATRLGSRSWIFDPVEVDEALKAKRKELNAMPDRQE